MVKIRLSRIGAKGQPYYRVVVVDERKKRDGAVLESIGTYNPRTEPSSFEIDKERLKYWRSVGAQLTEPVMVLLGEGKPKVHQPKNVKKEEPAAPVSTAPAAAPLPEATPTEGADKVEVNAPETTPEASPELALAEAASEAVSPEATPEVVAETVENKEEIATSPAAEQGEPTSQEVKADEAEMAGETDNSVETAKS